MVLSFRSLRINAVTVCSLLHSGFSLSLLVETVQLIAKVGCFDVDDIFLNTIGGMLGYLVYALVQRKRDRDADARRLKERS